jgi:hypothetical protein
MRDMKLRGRLWGVAGSLVTSLQDTPIHWVSAPKLQIQRRGEGAMTSTSVEEVRGGELESCVVVRLPL